MPDEQEQRNQGQSKDQGHRGEQERGGQEQRSHGQGRGQGRRRHRSRRPFPHHEQRSDTTGRKQQHVDITVNQDVTFREKKTGFEGYDFVHLAVPELNLSEIDTSTTFLRKELGMPLMITGMTGGYHGAVRINGDLARVCEERRLAMGVGSQRQALEDDSQIESYRIVRRNAPTIPVVGNIGAAQVVKGLDENAVRRLIDLVQADALAIHLNALQEAVQREGETNFKGLLKGIERLVKQLDIPVIAKETGAGISYEAAKKLSGAGVKIIDVSGAGGTSWSAVESFRGHGQNRLAKRFWDWGIPTAECVQQVADIRNMFVIASGGVRDGVDVAKALALGAQLAGMARPMIQTLVKRGMHALFDEVDQIRKELALVMFLTGSPDIKALREVKLVQRGGGRG